MEWYLAMRFLRDGRTQTVLIVAGVSVGIAVMVFLSALITGLQKSLIRQTLGTQAHIVVHPPDEQVRPLLASRSPPARVVASVVEKPAQRVRAIDQWQPLLRQLAARTDTTAVSPVVTGSALANRGRASRSVALLGIEPDTYEEIVPVAQHLVRGRFDVSGNDAVIGRALAEDLGVDVGGRIRVSTAPDSAELFVVRGVFDLGNRDVNQRWVLVSLRHAQTLLGLPGGVTHVDLAVDDIFAADAIADEIERGTGLVAESWMERNSQLLVALRSQSASSNLIQLFVVLAVAMGIASVLIVSVVQRSKQIGILRAIGATRRSMMLTFLIQGSLVGLVGALVGSGLGTVLALLFSRLAQNPDGSATFPVTLDAPLYATAFVVATITGLLSAVLPARRAARLDPVEAIRNA